MNMIDKFLENNVTLRGMLDTYLELRLHLQEEGYSQEALERVVRPTNKMIELRERFVSKKNSFIRMTMSTNRSLPMIHFRQRCTLQPIRFS